MDSKIDMSLDDIIKIDRKEKRQQIKSRKQVLQKNKKQAPSQVAKGKRQANANRQNRTKKQPNTAGSKVKQFRGQIGGNRYFGGAAQGVGNSPKRKQSATQQKAAAVKKKAKQAQKVGKQRLVPRKNPQQTGPKQRLQAGRKQRLQDKTVLIKDARDLLISQRRGLLLQGQPTGQSRGTRGRGRGRGRGGYQSIKSPMNLQIPKTTGRGTVPQQQPPPNRRNTKRLRGQQAAQAPRPGMLTMTIANPVATKSKPVKISRNHNLKQPKMGEAGSLSDRFGRIQSFKSAVKQHNLSQGIGEAQRGRGGGQRGGGRGKRGRGGRRNAGLANRSVVIL